ncbi:MAG: RsmE family RNA methyltransferase [Gemmatimonadaceae bacterium]
MVERGSGPAVGRAIATFFSEESVEPGARLHLGGGEAQHARVLRLAPGVAVRVTDGSGAIGFGSLVRLGKSDAVVEIEDVGRVDAPPAIHLLLPIASRDRMLFLAEKATELGVASWRPVLWRRSRSVSPRGEGVAFQNKVRSRMIGALTQSGGGWLPSLYPDAMLERALFATPPGTRLLLDGGGPPMLRLPLHAPLTLAVGPEGGIEDDERAAVMAAGFHPASLARSTLRFETAAIAALAVVRAALTASEEH